MGIFSRLFRTKNAFGIQWISVPQELIDVANTRDFCHYTINTRDGVASPPGLVSSEIIRKLIPFPDSEGYFHLDFPPFDRFELFLTPDNDVIFCTIYRFDEERVPLVTFASMLSLPGMKYSEKTIIDMIQMWSNLMPEEWVTGFKLNDVDDLFRGVSHPACLVYLHPYIVGADHEIVKQLAIIERTITRAWFTHYLMKDNYQMLQKMGF